jgi:hypothetical protein
MEITSVMEALIKLETCQLIKEWNREYESSRPLIPPPNPKKRKGAGGEQSAPAPLLTSKTEAEPGHEG